MIKHSLKFLQQLLHLLQGFKFVLDHFVGSRCYMVKNSVFLQEVSTCYKFADKTSSQCLYYSIFEDVFDCWLIVNINGVSQNSCKITE